MTLRFGVIPSNGRECLDQAVESLLPQVDCLAIVEGGSFNSRPLPVAVTFLPDPTRALNISRWWNIGLGWAQNVAQKLGEVTWDVAIINDDVVLPPTWLCYVADDMRALDCVAACAGGPGHSPIIHRKPQPVPVHLRMQGFAFVLAGESGLRADEELEWWYQDDRLGIEAAALGGMVMFPGCHVEHKFPNGNMTDERQVRVALDREVFVKKMGFAPW